MNGETCVLSESTIHLWHESQQELDVKFIVIISVTADSSLLSPTGGVKRISPDIAIHEQNGYAKLLDHKYNILMTNVDNDNSDKTYTNMREV